MQITRPTIRWWRGRRGCRTSTKGTRTPSTGKSSPFPPPPHPSPLVMAKLGWSMAAVSGRNSVKVDWEYYAVILAVIKQTLNSKLWRLIKAAEVRNFWSPDSSSFQHRSHLFVTSPAERKFSVRNIKEVRRLPKIPLNRRTRVGSAPRYSLLPDFCIQLLSSIGELASSFTPQLSFLVKGRKCTCHHTARGHLPNSCLNRRSVL